jgi:glycosyltransferase involved in cell wall biosynthesis
MSSARIVYVVDDPGWVQAARGRQLERHIPGLELAQRTPGSFARRWPWLRRRRVPVYFASWRILLPLDPRLHFSAAELGRFMVSVTSHYEIGGGLAPPAAVPSGADREAMFEQAVRVLRACKVVTVNSLRLKELLGGELPELIYAPNGVDTEQFAPPPRRDWDPDRIRIGWVGKVRAAKNFELLQEAVTALEQEGFQFEIVAARKHVRRQRLLDADELVAFYRGIDFYLCTSWHEGTPNPALEAAACGVPPVTTRVGNMPELVRHGENGFFVEPTSESLLATLRGLKRLDTGRYLRLSSAIRADVERGWTWERACAAYVPAFERLMEAPLSRPLAHSLPQSPLR